MHVKCVNKPRSEIIGENVNEIVATIIASLFEAFTEMPTPSFSEWSMQRRFHVHVCWIDWVLVMVSDTDERHKIIYYNVRSLVRWFGQKMTAKRMHGERDERHRERKKRSGKTTNEHLVKVDMCFSSISRLYCSIRCNTHIAHHLVFYFIFPFSLLKQNGRNNKNEMKRSEYRSIQAIDDWSLLLPQPLPVTAHFGTVSCVSVMDFLDLCDWNAKRFGRRQHTRTHVLFTSILAHTAQCTAHPRICVFVPFDRVFFFLASFFSYTRSTRKRSEDGVE